MSIIYNYKQENIEELSLINNNGNNWYNYKKFNFLSKLKEQNTNLIVFFHGALPNLEDRKCCFRGFNYEILDTDIVCASDILISIYQNFQISWYLSTLKHNVNDIYIETFTYLLSRKKYKNVIFTGTSGGGYPSLYFASYFNKIALIANSQIYPEHYYHFNDLQTKIKDNDDELLYNNKDIEMCINKSKPSKILLYQNLKDKGLKWISNAYYLPFITFIKTNNYDNILDLHLFEGEEPSQGKTDHHVNFPKESSHLTVLKDMTSFNS